MGEVYYMNQNDISDIGTNIEIIMDFLNSISKYNLPNRVKKLLMRSNNNINKMYLEMGLYNENPDEYRQEINNFKSNA